MGGDILTFWLTKYRDLKSSNLLVTEDLRIKVSDFGLARVKDGGFRIRNPLGILHTKEDT